MKWLFLQLFPRTYWTTYERLDGRYFQIWKMWFGQVYDKVEIKLL